MTDYTPLLHLPEVAPNQDQKEATINTALAILEASFNDTLTVSLASGNVTLNTEQFTRYFLHQFTGHSVTRQVNVPETPRWWAVENLGSANIIVHVAGSYGAVVEVPSGKMALLVSDGVDVRAVVPDPTGGLGVLSDLSDVQGVPTNNQLLRYVTSSGNWEPWTLSLAFSALSDFPGAYSSNATKLLAVKADGTGLEWVASSANVNDFLDLTDTPSSYSGSANRTVKVNSSANALVFAQPSLTENSNFPSSFTGAANKWLRVNSTPNAVVFDTIDVVDLTDGPGAPAVGESLKYVRVNLAGTALEYADGTGGPDQFYQLGDTPDYYTGFGGALVRVNAGETGLEFYDFTLSFLGLTDTPSSYSGSANRFLKVNSGATAVTFGTVSFSDLTDGPGAPAGDALKFLRVNSGATAVEYFTAALTHLSGFPSTYSGQGGKFLQVKPDETGVQFVANSYTTNFLALTDTPSAYTGAANKLVSVNGSATGLVFVNYPTIPTLLRHLADVEGGTGTPVQGAFLRWIDGTWQADDFVGGSGVNHFVSLLDGPGVFTGHALSFVRVNPGETALEYYQLPPIPYLLGHLADVETGTGTPDEGDVLTWRGGVWQPEAPTGGPGGGGPAEYTIGTFAYIDLTLTNPGAETGDTTGWTQGGGGFTVYASGASNPGTPINAYTGSKYFHANASASCSMAQTVDISAYADMIDAGDLVLEGYAFQTSTDVGREAGSIILTALSGSDVTLAVSRSATLSPTNGTGVWEQIMADMILPAATRKITLTLLATRQSGSNNNHAFDTISARLRTTAARETLSLTDLIDVEISTGEPTDGDVLTYDATFGQWLPAAPTGGGGGGSSNVNYLGDLADVEAGTGTPSEGYVLTWKDGVWQAEPPSGGGGGGGGGGGSSNVNVLGDLADVEAGTGTPSEGYILTWKDGVWQAEPPPGQGDPDIITREFAGVRLRKTADQSVTAATTTSITWDVEVFDTHTFHSQVGNTDRITIPADVSHVELTLTLRRSNVTEQLLGAIEHYDSSNTLLGILAQQDTDTAGTDTVSCSTGPVAVSQGDYFKATAFSTSAGDITSGTSGSWFSLNVLAGAIFDQEASGGFGGGGSGANYLDELLDVDTNTGGIAEGDLLVYRDGVWVPESPTHIYIGQAIEARWTVPQVADFTWNNQGTATATDGGQALVMTPGATANVRSLEKNAPATTFNAYLRLSTPSLAATSNQRGFWLRNSGNGRLLFFGLYNNSTTTPARLLAQRWTNSTTFSATIAGLDVVTNNDVNWLRVQVSATTVTFYVSTDGLNWVSVLSETISTFLTAAGGALDKVGFGVFSTGAPTTLFHSFSFTAPIALTQYALTYAPSPVINASGATLTLSAAEHLNSYVRVNSGVACTVFVPSDADDDIDIGSEFFLEQTGAGVLTVTEADSVTNLNSRGGLRSTAGRYAVIGLKKVASDTWTLTGDLA